jgi:hypothetical protein
MTVMKGRRALYRRLVGAGEMAEGYACDDSVGLLFEDERLTRVVTSRPRKFAYSVRRSGNAAIEEPLTAELLSGRLLD